MAFIFSFDLITKHALIPTDGVIYIKMDDTRLEKHTIALLIMTNGVVVEQTTVVSGDLLANDFGGMSVDDLVEWSSSSEYDEFETREIDVNERYKEIELKGVSNQHG